MLSNAIEYSPEGSRVDVVLRVGETCAVEVRDVGIGISQEMLPRVFELFAQADGSLDRAQGGSGSGSPS